MEGLASHNRAIEMLNLLEALIEGRPLPFPKERDGMWRRVHETLARAASLLENERQKKARLLVDEPLFHLLSTRLATPVCLVNAWGEIFFENEAAKKLFGYKPCLAFLKDYRATLAKLGDPNPFSEEITIENKCFNGQWMPLDKTIWLVEWQESGHGVTEESEMMQAVAEALGLIFYMQDRHGFILYLSDPLASILSIRPKDAAGRHVSAFGLENRVDEKKLVLGGKTFAVQKRTLSKALLVTLKDISAEVSLGSSLQEMREAVAKGDLSKRIAPPAEGTPRIFADAVNGLLAANEKSIHLTTRFLDILARGNLRIRFKEKGTPLTKPLLQAFERTLLALVERVKVLRRMTKELLSMYTKQMQDFSFLARQLRREEEVVQEVVSSIESLRAQLVREAATFRAMLEKTKENPPRFDPAPNSALFSARVDLGHALSGLSFEANLLALNTTVFSQRANTDGLSAIAPSMQKLAARLAEIAQSAKVLLTEAAEEPKSQPPFPFAGENPPIAAFFTALEQTSHRLYTLQITTNHLLRLNQKNTLLAGDLENAAELLHDEGFTRFLQELASFRIPGDDSAIDVTPKEI